MRPTVEYIERKFDEFNKLMFKGKLPKIPIELSDAKTFLGKCTYKKRRLPNGEIKNHDFKLRINVRIDLPEAEIEDTIIHEMIHYCIAYNHLKDTSSHGKLFCQIMDMINRTYGRHLTISYRSTSQQNEDTVDKRPHYHVIAVVDFVDGRTGVKVLPRVLPSILKFYNGVLQDPSIKKVSLYMSNDIFFNQFPNSSALRLHIIPTAELMSHLTGAEKMACDGHTITRNAK